MPVAVELNGLLPGLGPGRGAPGRGPDPPGLGAPGRGAPGPWVLGAEGLPPGPPWPGWSGRPAGAPGRCPPEPPGAPGRGAEGRVWLPWPVPGLRKSAGVAGVLGGPGTLGAPGVPWGLESVWGRSGSGPGRDAGDGGTGGSRRAAVSGATGAAAVPFTAAPSGAAARSAEPLAAPSGAVRGTGGTPEAVPAAAAAARSSRAFWGAVPALTSGRGRAPTPGAAWPAGAAAGAPSRGADDAAGLGLDPGADCCATLEANASLSRRTTGASIVEDADLTNSPISWSLTMTALLSTPNSFASS